ncbi:MAG: S1C family serine protease [Thermomicrobiales bacterium]
MSLTRTRTIPVVFAILIALFLSACSLGINSSSSTKPAPTTAATAAPTTVATATVSATTAPSSTVAGITAPNGTTTGASTAGNATTASASTTANAGANATPGTTLISAPVSASGQLLSVAAINRAVRPAVVQITNNQKVQGRFGQSNGIAVPAGVGTGFIFDKRGYILTNNHVVDGANSLTIATTDNKTYDGKIVGTYAQGDLAVVQINGNGDLPTVALGDSSKLEVGDPLVAIGNALALAGGPTVTSGVVSALGRVPQEPGSSSSGNSSSSTNGPFLVDLIQTDAAINPGNSGGPLLNAQGQVVGINTLGAGQAEPGVQAQGIGFAISINSAKPVADALIAGQPVPRPFVGITTGSLNPQQDAQLGLPANAGVGIASVQSGSPADKAGLQANDVIVKFDGQAVQGEEGFVGFLLSHKPGDTVTFTVLRNKQQQDIKVTLAQAPTS